MKGKRKMVFGAFVVAAIAAMMVLSGVPAANGTKESNSVWAKNAVKLPIKIMKLGKSVATTNDGNVLVSAGSAYDDVMPAITTDDKGHIVVTWTQQIGVLSAELGFAYSGDNGQSWNTYNTSAGELLTHSDISWQDCKTYTGLYGVYLDETNDYMGFYTIGDITDPTTFQIGYWTSEIADPVYACVADNTYLEGQYYDVDGPACMYIYHEVYDKYDIPGCPIQMIADLTGGSGELTFDGQSHLITAPADNPDMAGVNMDVHYAWDYYNATLQKYQIVWKKIIPVEGDTDSTDIEFTPYQAYIDTGRDPAISKSGDNVVIVYMNNNNIYGDWDIKCAYSNDDGATWSISTVAEQHPVNEMHPDVYITGNNVYVAYVSNGNLYLVKSTDGGATWGEPIQINDNPGSVVAEPGCVDVSGAGIVWEDNRNGNIDVYYAPLPAPRLHITLSGGFGITVHIENTGTEAAQNAPCSIKITGGLVIMGKETQTTVTINPGESVDVKVLPIGIGKVTVTATAGGATAKASGFLLGPLVLGLK